MSDASTMEQLQNICYVANLYLVNNPQMTVLLIKKHENLNWNKYIATCTNGTRAISRNKQWRELKRHNATERLDELLSAQTYVCHKTDTR